MNEQEMKKFFDQATKKCISIDRLRAFIGKKAKCLKAKSMADVLPAIFADFENSQECKERGCNPDGFGLWLNIQIQK